jgi:predicted AlkP superfamily pyrophosphatase or phosphodiesterase
VRIVRALAPALCALCVAVGSPAAQSDAPRLMVIVVVDQMRADYLTTFGTRWHSGFRTLLDRGAYFSQAEYPYLTTVTCAGHATIATGTFPRTHGLIMNRWWHRDERRTWECTDDPAAPHISYGRPAESGSSAKRLLVPTLADELRAQQPGARVVSLALKPRAAIPLAGRGGHAVTWFDEDARSFVTSRAFANAPVTAVRRFVAGNPVDAQADDTWALQDRDETYQYPDLGLGERPPAGWTSLFPHPLSAMRLPNSQFFERWQHSPFADAYVARMAVSMVDAFRLGQRDATDFLGVSFSALDLVGHDFGPRSREVEDLLIHLDAALGALIQKLDDAVGRDKYVLALTGDHGVAAIPEDEGAGRVTNEDLQQLLEQLLIVRWGAPATGRYVESVTSGNIFFAAGVFERLKNRAADLEAVERTLLSLPAIARVLQPDRFPSSASDAVVRAAVLSYVPRRSGDLVLVPRQNWITVLRSDNYATSHGTLYDYDRQVPMLLAGAGIRPGRYTERVTPADVAPTLAAVAHVMLPRAEGRVLREALK